MQKTLDTGKCFKYRITFAKAKRNTETRHIIRQREFSAYISL